MGQWGAVVAINGVRGGLSMNAMCCRCAVPPVATGRGSDGAEEVALVGGVI